MGAYFNFLLFGCADVKITDTPPPLKVNCKYPQRQFGWGPRGNRRVDLTLQPTHVVLLIETELTIVSILSGGKDMSFKKHDP